jgi:hypothetical protein
MRPGPTARTVVICPSKNPGPGVSLFQVIPSGEAHTAVVHPGACQMLRVSGVA